MKHSIHAQISAVELIERGVRSDQFKARAAEKDLLAEQLQEAIRSLSVIKRHPETFREAVRREQQE